MGLVQVAYASGVVLVLLFGAMVAVSVLGAVGWIEVPGRVLNALFVASMLSIVTAVFLVLSTALL